MGRERTKGEEMAAWFPMKSRCTVRSVLAVQQLGRMEGDVTAVQTKQQEETFLPSSTTAKLRFF